MSCILGIETATDVLSVGLVNDHKFLAEISVFGKKLHSVRLMPIIKDVLNDAGVTLKNLSGIAVSTGPGSFTGIRLGVATGRTLAQVLKLPAVGIPTTLALATPLLASGVAVCPVIVSRRDEVYAAVYQVTGEGLNIVMPVFAAPPAETASRLKSFEKIILAGDGAYSFRKIYKDILGDRLLFAPEAFAHPQGAVIAELGLKEIEAGRSTDCFALRPEYLRPPAITGG
ncbi:MAG: tRNA (adenosine(37)-N6)-threonylcarbamoyltransferase complex dimerization subunit type 1 TsaB [Bacillota bacterium]